MSTEAMPCFPLAEPAELLALLGNPVRHKIVTLVLMREWEVKALAREVNMSSSATSQHLKKLRDAKLVERRKSAQTAYYSSSSLKARALGGALDKLDL